jgi:hypothetical protein
MADVAVQVVANRLVVMFRCRRLGERVAEEIAAHEERIDAGDIASDQRVAERRTEALE